MVPHFAYALQCLVVREYTEAGAPKVAAEAFEGPDDAASLQRKRKPMPFRVERSSSDLGDGFYGAVRLHLFESGAEPVDAGVALHVKQAYAVGGGVPIGENEDRRGRELRQDFSHQFLHNRRACKLNPLPEERVNRTNPLRYVGQTFAVIVDSTHECAHLLNVCGHRHIGQCRHFFCVWA